MILGFTGTRIGMDDQQRTILIKTLDTIDVDLAIHGGCLGSDAEFHHICEERDIPLEIYPGYSMKSPYDDSMQAKELQSKILHSPNTHFARNRIIVDRCDLLFACPLNDNHRGGTWYTINYAQQTLVPTIIFKREY